MIRPFNLIMEEEPSALSGGGTSASTAEATPADAPPASSIWEGINVKFPDGLDDSLKAEPSLKPFVNRDTGEFNVANVLKSYIHTKKQIGADKVTLPKDTSTPEEIDQFWEKLGWTKEEDKYAITKPENAALEEDFINNFKKFAIENRLPASAAQKMVSFLNDKAVEGASKSQEAFAAKINEGLTSLQKEWGQAYTPKLEVAKKVLSDVIKDESVIEMFKDPTIGSNPAVIKALAAIGEKLFKEDGFKGETRSGALSPSEASARINQIMGDHSHAYNKPDHPAHRDAVNEVLKLYEMKKGV